MAWKSAVKSLPPLVNGASTNGVADQQTESLSSFIGAYTN